MVWRVWPFLVAGMQLYNLLCRSICPLVRLIYHFFMTFGHYCSCQIARNSSTVYPALLCDQLIIFVVSFPLKCLNFSDLYVHVFPRQRLSPSFLCILQWFWSYMPSSDSYLNGGSISIRVKIKLTCGQKWPWGQTFPPRPVGVGVADFTQ